MKRLKHSCIHTEIDLLLKVCITQVASIPIYYSITCSTKIRVLLSPLYLLISAVSIMISFVFPPFKLVSPSAVRQINDQMMQLEKAFIKELPNKRLDRYVCSL